MKKYIVIITIFGLLLIIPLIANASTTGKCGENAYYSIDTNTQILTIYGSGKMIDYKYSLDEDPRYHSLSRPWYDYKTTIQHIIIDDGITRIGDCAFAGLTNVRSISIPNSVTEIGAYSLEYLSSLQSISIPTGVTYIGREAFSGCASISSISIPNAITAIAHGLFYGCTSLTSISIPNCVTSIGSNAFAHSGIATINLPKSLQYLHCQAFNECANLKSITIPRNVIDIGIGGDWLEGDCDGYVFRRCPSLESIYFTGNAPILHGAIFMETTITAYYPADNSTYTEAVKHNYGGTVTWIPYTPTCSHENIVIDVRIEPTCTTTGLTEGQHCADCDTVIMPQEVIPTRGHILSKTNKIESTCIETGTEVYWICCMCGKLFSDKDGENEISNPIVLPALGHHEIFDSSIAPTCTTSGLTAGKHCERCDEILVEQLPIPALGHQWNTPIYIWSANNSTITAKRICSRDTSHIETETVSVTAEVTKPATCTEKGQTTYTSSVFANNAFAVQTKTLTDIPALGHQWGASTYTWSIDNTEVTAKRICANDASHVETETRSASAAITKLATCTEKGQTTYTSFIFTNSAFSVQTKVLTNINELGHTVVTDPSVAPTDCRPGLTEGSHCSVCNEVLTAQQTIHPLLWEIDETGGQVTILRYYGSETNVTLPSSPEGLPVRVIASGAFPYSNCPTRIFIPNSVQSISNTAFGRSITVYCHEYSEADYWADEVDYTAIYVDNTVSGTFYRITMPESFTMEYGETRNLGAVVWPLVGNDTITVTSSDPTVISVNGEKLTASGVGQTTVTLRAGGKSASVVVTVHANPIDFFIEDELSETNDVYYVLTKATKQLSVSGIQPVGAEATVTWTSSNESVAIVSVTGEVTAKRPGQAVITATAQNGLSRSCRIIVCYPVAEISFEQNAYNIPLGGRKQIKALVFTSDGDYINQLVSFSSSDETIATVDQHGIIKALKRGTVTITATADNGVSADCILNIQAAPSNQYIFSLPVHLTTIESEAFANLPAVKGVRIPAGVKFIANDAFAGSNVIILAPQGSYASKWALDHGMTVIEE